jgi:hypothetical protein
MILPRLVYAKEESLLDTPRQKTEHSKVAHAEQDDVLISAMR